MFRFTIRDVLWLMVVLGLGLAMLLNHLAWSKYHYESTKSLRQANRNLTDEALRMEREFLRLHVKAVEPDP